MFWGRKYFLSLAVLFDRLSQLRHVEGANTNNYGLPQPWRSPWPSWSPRCGSTRADEIRLRDSAVHVRPVAWGPEGNRAEDEGLGQSDCGSFAGANELGERLPAHDAPRRANVFLREQPLRGVRACNG